MLLAMQPVAPAPAPIPSSTLSGGVDSNKRTATDGPCLIFLQHEHFRMKRYKYHHDPANLAAPVAGSTSGNHHGSVSSSIAKPAAGGTGCNRNGLGDQRNGSDGTRNGSISRVGNAGTDSSSRSIVAWRGNRGGGGGRGDIKGGGSSSGGGVTANMSSSG